MSRRATARNDHLIRCPFFRLHERRCIGCEGFTPDHTIRLWFETSAALDLHEARWCMTNYERCPFYRAILEQYE